MTTETKRDSLHSLKAVVSLSHELIIMMVDSPRYYLFYKNKKVMALQTFLDEIQFDEIDKWIKPFREMYEKLEV
jgi:hypothetical protein